MFSSLRTASSHGVGLLKLSVETGSNVGGFENVSTVSEIEHALERLPDTEVVRLAAWLAEHRRSRHPRRRLSTTTWIP